MEALGRVIDIAPGVAPEDMGSGGATGKRVSLRDAGGVTFIVAAGVASAGTDPFVATLREHDAATAGNSADLAVIDHYFVKSHATAIEDETWERVEQSAAAAVTLAGATYAAQELILVIEVEASSLSDGFDYVSINLSGPTSTNTKPSVVAYGLRDLAVQRAPQNLPAPQ